tara:strand:- start:218 stop:592 length:375 start_codon:yes stop_codon:yes gene_type:complete
MENPSISSKSQTRQFEPIPSSEVIMAQVAVCGPGLKDWYWTKLSSLGKFLKTLPIEIRVSVGYVPHVQKRKSTPHSCKNDGQRFYLQILAFTTNSSFTKDFSTVDDLLLYLDGEPKIGMFLRYS